MSDAHYSYNEMSFVWDEDKNKKNIKDHGIPFTLAAAVFDDEYRLEFFDEKHSSNTEDRYLTIGLVRDIITVVYCERKNPNTDKVDTRIISARLASPLEQKAYNNIVIGRY